MDNPWGFLAISLVIRVPLSSYSNMQSMQFNAEEMEVSYEFVTSLAELLQRNEWVRAQ